MSFEVWLQQRLTAHGYPVGLIDGIIGPVTVRALKEFQIDHGLPITSVADPLSVMGLRAEPQQATPKEMIAIPDRELNELDPVAPKGVKNVWPTQAGVPAFYGAMGSSLVKCPIPFDMRLAWDKNTRIRAVTVHAKVKASAQRCFERIAQTYSARERAEIGLDLFGGSYNQRPMRGGRRPSMHSWAIALDFDPERNQLSWHKPQARLSEDDAVPFWEIWEAEGWVSLGRARNFDWMHVQAARL